MRLNRLLFVLPVVAILSLTSCAQKVSSTDFRSSAKQVKVSTSLKSARLKASSEIKYNGARKALVSYEATFNMKNGAWIPQNSDAPSAISELIHVSIYRYEVAVDACKSLFTNPKIEYFASSNEHFIKITFDETNNNYTRLNYPVKGEFECHWGAHGYLTKMYEMDEYREVTGKTTNTTIATTNVNISYSA